MSKGAIQLPDDYADDPKLQPLVGVISWAKNLVFTKILYDHEIRS